MIQTKSRTIDGIETNVTQFDALRACTLIPRLGKILAPVAGMLKGVNADTDIEALGPALGALFTRLEGDELRALVCDLLVGTTVVADGAVRDLSRADNINAVFSSRLGVMFKVLAFVLEVNFGSFFGGSASSALPPKA
jgi:hypothetical protein